MRFTPALFATVLLAITVSSSPLQKRQDDEVDYVDTDLTNLFDDAPAPVLVALPPAVTAVANINTAAAAASISAELATSTFVMSDATPTDAPSRRSLQKRVVTSDPSAQQATCDTTKQTSKYSYTTSPDTPSAFQNDPTYSSAAQNAARYPPVGYTPTFNNLQGASLVPKGAYYSTYFLSSYDANECASKCTADTQCRGFNIYFERDPQYTISKSDGSNCPGGPGVDCCTNPVSLTQVKCVVLGYAPGAAAATNKGQFQNKYQFVIAGSDGFSQNSDVSGLPALDGYTRPHSLGSCIPKAQPGGQLMTPTKFPGSTSFSDCAAYCTNIKGRTVNGVQRKCAYFVVAPTYNVNDESYYGLSCAPYTADQAANEGGTSNSDTTNCGDKTVYYANAASYLREQPF